MDQLPDLIEGQPPWVVIVVAVLLVAGALGVALVKRGDDDDDDEPDRPARIDRAGGTVIPAGADQGALTIAMNHLADTARSERAEAEQARQQADALRARLEECSGEVMTLQGKLASVRAALRECQAGRAS